MDSVGKVLEIKREVASIYSMARDNFRFVTDFVLL